MTPQDLLSIKLSLKATRQRLNEELDAIEARIDRLLPETDGRGRYERLKNKYAQDFAKFGSHFVHKAE